MVVIIVFLFEISTWFDPETAFLISPLNKQIGIDRSGGGMLEN